MEATLWRRVRRANISVIYTSEIKRESAGKLRETSLRDEASALRACRNSCGPALAQPLPDRGRLHHGRCYRTMVGCSRPTRSRGSVSKRGTEILLDPKDVYDYLSGAVLAFKSLPQAMAMTWPQPRCRPSSPGTLSDDAEHQHYATPTVITVASSRAASTSGACDLTEQLLGG